MWGNEGQRRQSEPGQRNHSLCKTEGSANARQEESMGTVTLSTEGIVRCVMTKVSFPCVRSLDTSGLRRSTLLRGG